jgi:hypothetical protein
MSPRTKPDQVYLGQPCRNGHSDERYKANGKCVACHRERLTARHRAFQKRRGPTKPELAAKARAKARKAGRTFYKGQPCKYGHSGKHLVSTAMCAHPDCVRRYRHPPLHELPRREHERLLRVARDRSRRATRALQVLKELGLTL